MVDRSERQERLEGAVQHARSSQRHKDAAERHVGAALRWDALGDYVWAEFERRDAQLERDAAELEDDRARFYGPKNA